MKKKVMSLIVVFLLISNSIYTGIGGVQQVQAAESTESNIFTDVLLADSEGNEIDGDQYPEHRISLESVINVSLNWEYVAGEMTGGEIYFYSLPSSLLVLEDQEGILTSHDGEELGTFQIGLDGKIAVSFREDIHLEQNVSGELNFQTSLAEVELEYLDDNGLPINPPIGTNSTIIVKYQWALQNNHGYKEGAKFYFNLPVELDVYEPIERAEMKFNGTVIAYLSVNEAGEATVEFTEFIEQYSNINGTMEIWTELSEEIIITEEKEVIITPIDGGEALTIPIDFRPEGPTINKKGIPNRAYNAESITWTIDFNKLVEKVENAILSDPIQDGQKLKESTIKLYYLDVKLNGEVVQGAEVDALDYTISKTIDGKDFLIDFNGDIDSAYRLVYETEITDEDQATFTNRATLFSNDTEKVHADATVTIGRGKPLEKKSTEYDKENQIITWEIKYNYNEKTIRQQDAVLIDFFNKTQELLEDSFEVYQITIDENGKESGKVLIDQSKYEVTPRSKEEQNGFEFQFKEDINAAYKIIYKTKASERVFESENILNKVIVGEHEATGNRNIEQQILFKSHGKPDYKDKLISWTISFNHDNYTMENVKLVDTFTNKGLTLVPDSIKITPEVNFTLTDGQDGFELVFNEPITSKHTITYTTNFAYDERADKSLDYLQNHAHLIWTEDGKKKEKEAVSTFKPDNYTKSNGYKNGSYNAVNKEITWNIGINYNLKTLDKAIVEDFIIGNQQLVKDSIKVYNMELTGEENGVIEKEAVQGKDYSISWIEDENNQPGFRIEFKGEIDSAYLITYKTSLNDLEFIEANYHNTASLYNDSQKETELKASVGIPHGGKYTTKSGVQNGKIIDWTVNINFAQAQIRNAKITDTPSDNQSVLEHSIQLFSTTVDEKGNVKKADKLVLDEDYTVEFTEDPFSFSLAFTNEINEPYLLEYQSLIQAQPGEYVNNDITFTGEHINPGDEEKVVHHLLVKRTAGMGDGKGELGRLTVVKTDADSGERLKDALFTLKDADSGIAIKTLTTNVEGIVIFDRLLFGDYLLVEESAPEGYLIKQKERAITIDKPYEADNEQKVGNEITVSNQKVIRAVQLIKKDKETGAVLAGADFLLQKKVNDSYQTVDYVTTDENGVIYKDGLESGQYQFVEVKAPDGYQLGSQPIPFTILENQIKVIELIAENLKLGSVQLVKYDEDNKDIKLENAEFKLLREDGSVIHPILRTDENGHIYVSNLKPGNYQFIETKAPNFYQLNSNPIEFTIYPGETATISVDAPNSLITGKVELIKVDQDDEQVVLQDAEFMLLDSDGNTLLSGLKTNEEGKIVVEDLKPGSYQFIETKAPKDYQLDDSPIPFTIEKTKTTADAKTVSVIVKNELIPGSVELIKIDKDDHQISLVGAEFELLDMEGNSIQTGLTTNEEGLLVVKNLKPGSYQFVETKAPTYYQLSTEPIPFKIVRSQSEVLKLTVENEFIRGSVELTKFDLDNNNTAVTGAEFELQDSEGNVIQEGLTTDGSGKILVRNLKVGSYQFVETKAPFGYILDQTPILFTIEKAATEADVKVVKVTAHNELSTGNVELLKVDIDHNNSSLPGAEFELRDSNGNIVQTNLVTDQEGKILVENLKPGDYQFVETKAPFGYILDQTAIPFTIAIGQVENVTLVAENELMTGSVELIKVDRDNQEILLEGAEFVLQDAEGNPLRTGLITNAEGKIVVDNLKPGLYQFVETKAPFGYELDNTPIPFMIEKGQVNMVVKVMENELSTGSVELIKVDKDNHEITLADAEFELQDALGNTLQTGLKTNTEGKIMVDNLKPGQYQFVEMEAPTDYQLASTPIVFVIEKGQKITLNVLAENELIPGSVELIKVDKDNPELVLEGVEFELQDEKGNTLQTELTTTKEGKLIVNNLKPGIYQFIETKAPTNYQLSSEPIQFEIVKGQQKTLTLTVTNELIRGAVELIKVDKSNHKVLLSGAEFMLMDAQGNVLFENLVSDQNGSIIVKDLKPGDYTFVETKAPKGYEKGLEPIPFTIEKGQVKMVSLIVTNIATPVESIIEDKPEQPGNTGGQKLPDTAVSYFNLLFIGMITLGLGVFLLITSRRKLVD